MRKTNAASLTFIFVFLASTVLLVPQPTMAETTIVVPDDYSSLHDAINHASDGDTIQIKAGAYQEPPINTSKSLKIIGEGNLVTAININCPALTGDIYGATITYFDSAMNVKANDFTLSDLSIKTNGGDIRLDGNNTTIVGNKFSAPFKADGSYLTIANNQFLKAHFSSGYGINVEYSIDCFLYMSNFSSNTVEYDNNMCTANIGGYYNIIKDNTISGACLGIGGTPVFFSGNTITNSLSPFWFNSHNSTFTKNTLAGIAYGFGGEGTGNTIFANQISNCGTPYGSPDKHFPPSESHNDTNQFFGNNFIDSSCPLHGPFSNKGDFFDNGTLGNFWSDYRGADSNGDGVGDTPFQVKVANGTDFYPLISPFNISAADDLIPNWAQNLNAIALATADDYSTVALMLGGNITGAQMSNVRFQTNQTTANFSFTLTGLSGTIGFCNITIPASAAPSKTAPTIYIDNQPAPNQGYSQDATNIYIWYITQFSTHQITIVFTLPSASANGAMTGVFAVGFAVVVATSVLLAAVYFTRRRSKTA